MITDCLCIACMLDIRKRIGRGDGGWRLCRILRHRCVHAQRQENGQAG
jgi:hypothetical protein